MSGATAAGPSAAIWTTYALLALSIALVWLPARRFGRFLVRTWAPVYLLAVVVALSVDVLRPTGAVALAVLLGAAAIASRIPEDRAALRRGLQLILGLLMLPLALHLVPGFNNPKLFDRMAISDAAPLFTQYLNFDKASAGLILLAFLAPLASSLRQWRIAFRTTLVIGVPTVLLTATAGLLLGYLAPDLKIPPRVAGVLLAQLFFICAAEEAFFRGFIQEQLHRAVAGTGHALVALVPAVAATGLFAAVHAGGGWQLVLLAGISGTGAAVAYARTRSVEAPILIHFAVNATHLFTLTYPHLAQPYQP